MLFSALKIPINTQIHYYYYFITDICDHYCFLFLYHIYCFINFLFYNKGILSTYINKYQILNKHPHSTDQHDEYR